MSAKKIVKQKYKKALCMEMSTNTVKKYWIMDGIHTGIYFPHKFSEPVGSFISEGLTPAKAWANALSFLVLNKS